MATLRVDGPDLVVDLSLAERIGGLVGGVRVPLATVTGVRTTDTPYAELRGLRVGTGLPWVVVLGRRVTFGEGSDFVVVYGRRRPTVVVDLAEGARFRRLLLTDQDPAIVDRIREATAR